MRRLPVKVKRLSDKLGYRAFLDKAKNNFLSSMASDTLLDFGCGAGDEHGRCRVHNKEYIGVDPNPDVEERFIDRGKKGNTSFLPFSCSDFRIVEQVTQFAPSPGVTGYFFLNQLPPDEYHKLFRNMRSMGVTDYNFVFYDPDRLVGHPVAFDLITPGSEFVGFEGDDDLVVTFDGNAKSTSQHREGFHSNEPCDWNKVLRAISGWKTTDVIFGAGQFHMNPHPSLFVNPTSTPGWEYVVDIDRFLSAGRDYGFNPQIGRAGDIAHGNLHDQALIGGLVCVSSSLTEDWKREARKAVYDNIYLGSLVPIDQETDFKDIKVKTLFPTEMLVSMDHAKVETKGGNYVEHKHTCCCGGEIVHTHPISENHGVLPCARCKQAKSPEKNIEIDVDNPASFEEFVNFRGNYAGSYPFLNSSDLARINVELSRKRWSESRMAMQQYGYAFEGRGKQIKETDSFPTFLSEIRTRLERSLSLSPGYLNSAIVRDYPPNVGLRAHTDDHRFGNYVVGITLKGTGVMRFADGENDKTLNLNLGSAFVMHGYIRRSVTHEVKPGPARRSVTFRHVENYDVYQPETLQDEEPIAAKNPLREFDYDWSDALADKELDLSVDEIKKLIR